MIDIGFTGTRGRLTEAQEESLRETFAALSRAGGGDTVLHHGDCVGADVFAHAVAWFSGYRIVAHPPTDEKHRAPSGETGDANFRHPPKPYMERNEDIVAESDVLVAAPSVSELASPRSGTWATVRRARAAGVPVRVVYASGVVEGSGRIVVPREGKRAWEAPAGAEQAVHAAGEGS